MTVITETLKRAGYYLGEAAPYNMINEEIIVASGAGVLDPGTVLGQIVEGAQTTAAAVALGTNVGNGTVGSLTADAGTAPGNYKIIIVEPAANAGAFIVEAPDGQTVGEGDVGVAFNGPINFTVADGSTDFAAGDAFVVAVSYATSGKYVLHDAALTNGAEAAAAILFNRVDATSGDVSAVATVRGPATVNGNLLTYKTGISAGNKAAAIAALKAKGMIVLPQHAS